MRAAIADIRELTQSDEDGFEVDRRAQQTVAYNLAVLGEARALSPKLRDRYPAVPWRNVIAQRNVVVHEYHTLNANSLWATSRKDIPELDVQLAAIEAAEREG